MSHDRVRQGAFDVLETLREAGFEAWWAGGCVRDQLMGRAPEDYDIATNAHPDQVAGLFDKTVLVGAHFGVVVVIWDDEQYEVATFRTERGYSDGRRPDAVEWATAREDVLRRDFTINGLLYDPVADEVADHVGGRDDITAGLIRAIGDPEERFAEDRLRLIRAVRFAARFEFEIEPETWRAVTVHAPSILEVSAERIRDELQKILTEGNAPGGIELLASSGLLEVVLPELTQWEAARDRFATTTGNPSPAVAWAMALYDAAPAVDGLGMRLRWPRSLVRDVANGVKIAHDLMGYEALDIANRKRLLRSDGLDIGARVAIAAADSDQAPGDGPRAAARDRQRWSADQLRPEPLLTGDDLRALGYPPGPWFGEVLRRIEDGQLVGKLTSREQALMLVETLARCR